MTTERAKAFEDMKRSLRSAKSNSGQMLLHILTYY
ncbi:hypothetical protein T01_11946 [Trichinella spiralis]|uniref:Uncharacterized protein n=1 Tax=Trichinella spiralis TaxID=6334 RepID=A0A0V1AJB1_TRISP|nr:hypothetical protein T01_11946 [Trichinella spiralis]